jgi:hypothetical protein
LIATIALVIAASSAVNIFLTGSVMYTILANIVTFVFPASLIVALKAIWQLASA